MSQSRESSCTSEGSLAEQQYEEVQEHHLREVNYNKINTEQAAYLSAFRLESNSRLAQYAVPQTPPTSRTEVAKLLEQMQGVTTNIIDISKSQLDLAARYLKCLRHARLIRNRLLSVGVTGDTHGMCFMTQDQLTNSVAKNGCNRALRIFNRQSLHHSAPKTSPPARVITKTAAPTPRKPRAKKVVETKVSEALPF